MLLKILLLGIVHDVAAAGLGSKGRAVVPSLLLGTHSRLLWLHPNLTEEVLHDGAGGVYHGAFAGHHANQVWVLNRPHNWRPKDAKERLLLLDLASRQVLQEKALESRCVCCALWLAGAGW